MVWAAWAGEWSVLAVVIACVIDGLADGVFAWLRARASFAAGSATDERDQVLVREFIKTYVIVVGAQAVIAYMVFSGLLLKPGGEAPVRPGAPFVTWQFWAVVAGLVVMRAAVYWWDFVRGGEAEVIPPEAAVSEPLRRLFILQFGVLAGALLVYWVFDSALTGLVVLLRREDGRRPRAGRPRAPARGAHHGGRGRRGRAARRPGQVARPARRPQAPPLTRSRGAALLRHGLRSLPRRPAFDTISPYHDAIWQAGSHWGSPRRLPRLPRSFYDCESVGACPPVPGGA